MACAANGIDGCGREVTPKMPQLVMEERPYAEATLLDPLGRVKCTEGAAKA